MNSAWIRDLRKNAPIADIETDVCVMGAGPVGLTLAYGLAKRGMSVTILDVGGATPTVVQQSSDLHFDRRIYNGATIGRALGLGGTSALWGGQLLPVRPADLDARPQIDAPAWPLAYSDIRPYFIDLQAMLGVRSTGFDMDSQTRASAELSSLDFSGWAPRLSKWLAFSRRNMAAMLSGRFNGGSGVRLWLNAAVRGWNSDSAGHARVVRELLVHSDNGESLRIHPRNIVIAAGALETARTVKELNLQSGSLSPGVTELTGRYLHDHLSLRIARVRVLDPRGFNARFAPYFEGPTMRSLRMELPPDILAKDGLPGLYAHFIAKGPETSGFAVLRDFLRATQRRDLQLALRSAKRAHAVLPDIANVVYTRLVKGRLAFPVGSEFFLHVDLEQAPKFENRVYLGPSVGGARNPLHIDWTIDEDAARISRVIRQRFGKFWEKNSLQRVAALDFLDLPNAAQAWNDNVYDLYHPAGTTRMAADSALGVVDENSRIHGTTNVFVAGSSVFPSMGAANPTFTAMALGQRLAHYLSESR